MERKKIQWSDKGRGGVLQRIVIIPFYSIFKDSQSKERENWDKKRREGEREENKMTFFFNVTLFLQALHLISTQPASSGARLGPYLYC